jgi:hypothetical protein
VLVDSERNTQAPAFDHPRLAASLSKAAKQEYTAINLPFFEFEFIDDGKAIHFSVDKTEWTCSLTTYDCKKGELSPQDTNEAVSPNKRWAAFVQDHNLFLRNTSTGTVLQLTHDAVASWDYATPLPSLRVMIDQRTEDVKQPAAVFWSPDSSKFVTYRIDSRNSGRFTSLQFVPPDRLRPKAFTYVYPLPGEVLAKAEPIIFDVQSGKRIDVTASIELPFQDGSIFDWFPDGKAFYYDYDERGYKAKELRVVDASTGEQKVLVREQSDTYVDPGETFFRVVEVQARFCGLRNGTDGIISTFIQRPGNWKIRLPRGRGSYAGSNTSMPRTATSISPPADARRMRIHINLTFTVSDSMAKACSCCRPRMRIISPAFRPTVHFLSMIIRGRTCPEKRCCEEPRMAPRCAS